MSPQLTTDFIDDTSSFIFKILDEDFEGKGYFSKNREIFSNVGNEKRKTIIAQYEKDILNVVTNDFFEDGVISQSESYILSHYNELNASFVKEATMNLYSKYYYNPHLLIGLLTMLGSLSYEQASPQGQIMVLGLLQHENFSVRDKAIQTFERWNSKKGINILSHLRCDDIWLQNYVKKVIKYLERDGID